MSGSMIHGSYISDDDDFIPPAAGPFERQHHQHGQLHEVHQLHQLRQFDHRLSQPPCALGHAHRTERPSCVNDRPGGQLDGRQGASVSNQARAGRQFSSDRPDRHALSSRIAPPRRVAAPSRTAVAARSFLRGVDVQRAAGNCVSRRFATVRPPRVGAPAVNHGVHAAGIVLSPRSRQSSVPESSNASRQRQSVSSNQSAAMTRALGCVEMTDALPAQPPQQLAATSPPQLSRRASPGRNEQARANPSMHRTSAGSFRVDESDDEDAFEPLRGAARAPSRMNGYDRDHDHDHDYDYAQDLADLPSDAFDSSSPSSPPGDDVVVLSSQPAASQPRRLAAPLNGLRQTTLFRGAAQAPSASQASKRANFPVASRPEPPTHHRLVDAAIGTWVYPTNLGAIRDYQFNIVARGLFHNLLVALPTGLGKTFIAATVMLNWFRWTQDSQIVFVAPTKPLVSQQVEACFGVAGIPKSETSLLTGTVPPAVRAEEWRAKRVFFMTPQTILNDLKTGICDPKRIVLLVVDEAHRATGQYAYVEVVRFVRRFNDSFRVLALTATPGSDVESVQKVIDGLDIARVEIRTEQSLDIRSYVNGRHVHKQVFDNTEEMLMCMELYSKAVQPVLAILNGQNAYWLKDPVLLTPFGCTQARAKWMSEAGRSAPWGLKGMVNSIFTILASLAHSMELLKYHGIGPFYRALAAFRDSLREAGGGSKYKRQIDGDKHFEALLQRLKAWVGRPDFVGHPKLQYLQEAIVNHFLDAGDGRGDGAPSATRIMVFAHWRDSAEEIVRVLRRSEPIVRPHVFVGQATTKNSEGMDQKRQLEVIGKFKAGVYNTLVATSIGEEGLDIGEVDLIVCYDSKASPIRMLQRMGRTGRKRAGRIILLQMRGKEEDDALKAKDSYETMQELIASGSRFRFHDDRSRRIIPREVQPRVDKRVVEIPIENTQGDALPEPRKSARRAAKRPPKKFHMPDGVRTGFVAASRMHGDDGAGEAASRRSARRPGPAPFVALEPLPALDEVVLTPDQERDLERIYRSVWDGDDALTVAPPRLNAHPEQLRVLGRTKYTSHSSVTEGLSRIGGWGPERLEALSNALHRSDLEDGSSDELVVDDAPDGAAPARPSTLPRRCAGGRRIRSISSTPPEPAAPHAVPRRPRAGASKPRKPTALPSDCTMEAPESSPPPTDPGMRLRSQAITLGTQDTTQDEAEEADGIDPDSELADFVVDDAEPIPVFSSSLPASSLPGARSIPFRRPAPASLGFDDEDDDLADTATAGRTRPRSRSEDSQPPARPTKRARKWAVSDGETESE